MRQSFTIASSPPLRRFACAALLSTAVLFGLALSAISNANAAQDEQEQQDMLSMRNAVEQVKRDTNGKILSVRSVKTGKVKFYRVKVLTRAGRVHVVQIPLSATKLSAQAQIKAPETVKKDQ